MPWGNPLGKPLLSSAILLCSLAFGPACADNHESWKRLAATTERQAERFERTRRELQLFADNCSWLADAWAQLSSAHERLDTLLVFDARHGQWPGIGDSQERLFALLRVARSLQRCGPLEHLTRSHHRSVDAATPSQLLLISGDAQPRVLAPISCRAGFVWSDNCADHGGPKRNATPSVEVPGGCLFDQAWMPFVRWHSIAH